MIGLNTDLPRGAATPPGGIVAIPRRGLVGSYSAAGGRFITPAAGEVGLHGRRALSAQLLYRPLQPHSSGGGPSLRENTLPAGAPVEAGTLLSLSTPLGASASGVF